MDSFCEKLFRDGSRAAATSKMERFVIIVNVWKHYHKSLYLGCCSSPRSAKSYYLQKEYQKHLFLLSQVPENKAKTLIMNYPAITCLLKNTLDFLTKSLQEDYEFIT